MISGKAKVSAPCPQPRVGNDGGRDDGDGDDGDGRIFPEHPSPILHTPRDNISRNYLHCLKGKSLRYVYRTNRFVYIRFSCTPSVLAQDCLAAIPL